MAKSPILVVDDDASVRKLLRNLFEEGGYAVEEAGDVETALRLVRTASPRLVTLDLQLGSEDGLEVARAVRKVSGVPIIMVTARGDVVDRVVGLEVGADDYIAKPFHVREVMARVRSVLRRADRPDEPEETAETSDATAYVFDDLMIVPSRFELYDRSGELSDLTTGDFKLLDVFVSNAKRVMSRDRLMDLMHGVEWSPLDRTIDNQVARLRKKIERNPKEPQLIKTVRGVGYIFACEVKKAQSVPSPKSA